MAVEVIPPGIPEPTAAQKPEALRVNPLQVEINRQAELLKALNLPGAVGLDESSYLQDFRLPQDFDLNEGLPQAMQAQGLTLPVVVDPRIPIHDLIDGMRINDPVPQRRYINLNPLPAKPYLVFSHDQSKWERMSVKEAGLLFGGEITGSSLREVLQMQLAYQDLFTDAGFEAAGSRGFLDGDRQDYENEAAPYLSHFGRDLRLAVGLISNHVKGWSVSSRSREHIALG